MSESCFLKLDYQIVFAKLGIIIDISNIFKYFLSAGLMQINKKVKNNKLRIIGMAGANKCSYLCITFFIVLDLRLVTFGTRRSPIFFLPKRSRGAPLIARAKMTATRKRGIRVSQAWFPHPMPTRALATKSFDKSSRGFCAQQKTKTFVQNTRKNSALFNVLYSSHLRPSSLKTRRRMA